MHSGRHYRLFLEGAPDAFFAHDMEGRFIDVNRQACVGLGYTREELLRLTVMDVDPGFDLAGAQSLWNRLEPGKTIAISSRHRRKDGSEFPVEVHVGVAELEGSKIFFGQARDISEREQAERRQARLTSLYRALSEINQMIVRVEEPAQMFERVCRVAVELGGMRMAWIGQSDPVTQRIVPIAFHGVGTDYLQHIVISADAAVPEGRGPTGTAFREKHHVIVNDFQHDQLTSIWHAPGIDYGWRSSASFPILRGGDPFAVLAVYHEYPDAFDKEMVDLLDEMVMDISFGLDGIDRDIQRKLAEKTVREQNNFLQAIFDSEPECVKVISLTGELLQMNRAGLAMLEADSVEQVAAIGLFEFAAPEFRAGFADFHRYICAGNSGHFRFRLIGRNGTERWLETHASPLRDGDGQVIAHLGVTRDITEKKRSDELIWRQANFDQLTGLPNRNMFQDRLQQEIKKCSRNGEMLAVIFIDMDRFKEVNDTLGHQAGDILLVEAARRIAASVRDADTVARLGGDEFMVILPNLRETERVTAIADNILQQLVRPFVLGEQLSEIHISASIGITLYPSDGNDADQLQRNVDQAMYVAKARGRNCFAWFTPILREQTLRRLRILQDLRGALAAQQLSVHFQPIVDLSSGRIVKMEALLRWQHPALGWISPAEFIPLAEEGGLIIEIGDWVMCEAIRWTGRWIELGAHDLQISVNVSPIQLQKGLSRIDLLYAYLDEFGLEGRNLSMEITEGTLLHATDDLIDLLACLRAKGVEVAIDDFGTGYSALSYLKKFDIDYLKIDRSFVRDLEVDPSDRALSEAIIVMAHKLGLKVIAEGVETQAQCDLLRAAGCDYAQGYFFSKPLPPEEIEILLLQNTP